jgi:hypothetical protein
MKQTLNRLFTGRVLTLCLAMLSALMLSGCGSEATAKEAQLTAEEVKSITREAYIYAYPMMDHYKMIYVLKVWEDSPVYEGTF